MTKTPEKQDWNAHAALLKSVSRSFFLSIKFLPGPMREPVALGYLLARLSDTIADSTGHPVDDRMALLNQYQAKIRQLDSQIDLNQLATTIGHSGEAHLLSIAPKLIQWLVQTAPENQQAIQTVIETIIHGQTWDLQHFQTADTKTTEEQLLNYTYSVAGCVGEFWTEVGFINLADKFACPENREAMLKSGKSLGQGLQMINIIRDLYEDIPAGRQYLPNDDVGHWLNVCRKFLDDGKVYPGMVKNPRARFATALPLYLAEATADSLEAAGTEEIMRRKIKITRSTVWKMMAKAALFT